MGMQRVCAKCDQIHHHFAKCKVKVDSKGPASAVPVTGDQALRADLSPLTAQPGAQALKPVDPLPPAPSNKAMEGGRKAPRVRRPAIGDSYGFQSRVPYSRSGMNTSTKYGGQN